MLRTNATCLGLNITQCFLEIACISMRDPNLANSWGEWVSLALPVSSGRYSTTLYNLRKSSLGLQINSFVWAKNIVGWPCKRQNLSLSWGRVIGMSPLLWMTLIAHLVLLCLLFFFSGRNSFRLLHNKLLQMYWINAMQIAYAIVSLRQNFRRQELNSLFGVSMGLKPQ